MISKQYGITSLKETRRPPKRLIATIWDTCTLLSRAPLIGRSREELAPDLRSFPVGNHVIFYRPTTAGIEVVRILGGVRDIPPLF